MHFRHWKIIFGLLFGLLWGLPIFAKAGNDKAFRTAFMFYLVK